MALPKKVKHGGSFFQGYQLPVLTSSGSYVLHISQANAFMINSIQFICPDSGAADFIKIEHYDQTSGGTLLKTIAKDIYNPGPGAPMSIPFPALEPFNTGHDCRFTYVNSGSVPMNVNVYVEFIFNTK